MCLSNGDAAAIQSFITQHTDDLAGALGGDGLPARFVDNAVENGITSGKVRARHLAGAKSRAEIPIDLALLLAINPSIPAPPKLRNVPPTVEHANDADHWSVDSVEHAVGSDDQLSIGRDADTLQLRHDPAAQWMRGKRRDPGSIPA